MYYDLCSILSIHTMMGNSNTYNYLEDYLLSVRAEGRYSVTLKELMAEFSVSTKAMHQSLFRVKSKNLIAQVRNGFYVIIPPEYKHQGMLPINLFVDDLMKGLKRDYYFGLYSAAAIYGVIHQKLTVTQIITKNPKLRNISNDKLSINFYTRSKWNLEGVIEKKSEFGYVKVSSPELTVLDLVSYSSRIGGIDFQLQIIKELTDKMKPLKLYKEAQNYGQISTVQRLGYILDKVLRKSALADALKEYLSTKDCYFITLDVTNKIKKGEVDIDWKIFANNIL
jgi:predicted transcriptional regulator of viral defense system